MGKIKERDDLAGAPEALVAKPLRAAALSRLTGYYLSMAALVVYRDFKAAMGALGLTQQQYAVLELIAANPGAAQIDIARTLDMDRATMLLLVDRLQDRGLVARHLHSADRRRVELHLASDGTALVARAREVVGDHEARLFAGWPGEDVERLRRLLAQLGSGEPQP